MGIGFVGGGEALGATLPKCYSTSRFSGGDVWVVCGGRVAIWSSEDLEVEYHFFKVAPRASPPHKPPIPTTLDRENSANLGMWEIRGQGFLTSGKPHFRAKLNL